jgi:hypothetical protein
MLLTVCISLLALAALARLGLAKLARRQARDRAAVIAQLRRFRAPGPQLSPEEVAYGLALAMGSIKSGKQDITLPAEAPRFVRDASALMREDDSTESRSPELDPGEEVYTYRSLGGVAIPTGKRALTAEERAVLC